MPGYGSFAYGSAPYGGGGEAPSAVDSWSISDSPTRQLSLTRNASDAWTVGDSASAIWGFDPNGDDSFSISDAATRVEHEGRSAADSLTLSDVVVAIHVPYVDLPALLVIDGDVTQLVLEGGGGMVLAPGTATLELQDGGKLELDAEDRTLAIRDEPGGLWADG